jgi:hypothetical protein
MKTIFLLLFLPVAIFAQATTKADTTKPFCVKAFQMALQAKGFYEGKLTNKWDDETKKAFVKCAKAEGMPACHNEEMILKAVEYAKFEQFCE